MPNPVGWVRSERTGRGAMVTPPMDVPDGPTIAFFADPAGNRVGLMKATG